MPCARARRGRRAISAACPSTRRTTPTRPPRSSSSEPPPSCKKRGYRVEAGDGAVAAERGYLREAGNLLFHLAVLVVLVGFAVGGLFGYKGGVILLVGNGFSNNLTQYDDFAPGSLFDPSTMEDFNFSVDEFDVTWLTEGLSAGQARDFKAAPDLHRDPGRARPRSTPCA